MRAEARSRLQPNATPCCMSPLDARAACCGCAGDSGSESEDSGADSDDEDVGNPVCDVLQHAERSLMTVQRRVGLHALHAVNDEINDTRFGRRLPSLKAGGGVALLVVRVGARVLRL